MKNVVKKGLSNPSYLKINCKEKGFGQTGCKYNRKLNSSFCVNHKNYKYLIKSSENVDYLLQIRATWIFDRYERVKESLNYIFHFLFTQPCKGNYFLFSGKQIFVSIKAAKICLEGSDYFWKEERL